MKTQNLNGKIFNAEQRIEKQQKKVSYALTATVNALDKFRSAPVIQGRTRHLFLILQKFVLFQYAPHIRNYKFFKKYLQILGNAIK